MWRPRSRRATVAVIAVVAVLVAGAVAGAAAGWYAWSRRTDAKTGGVFHGPAGSVLRIPPGALSRSTVVSLRAATYRPPDAVELVSPVLDVDLHGARLT